MKWEGQDRSEFSAWRFGKVLFPVGNIVIDSTGLHELYFISKCIRIKLYINLITFHCITLSIDKQNIHLSIDHFEIKFNTYLHEICFKFNDVDRL